MIHRGRLVTGVIIGDAVCALILSLIGFITHYGKIEGWHWLTTFIPVLIGWFAIAPWLGNYRMGNLFQPAHAWRAGLAAFLSAPLAAWIRGGWLNSAILPIFILVLGLTNALGFLIWRVVWSLILRRINRNG
ncbi:MAG: DUF3054 domain-containing protein [Anaerolineaceae bacterium]|nr:DUF3054 domain-containing protein [Anaerolineaceae bacterium]